MNRIKQLREEMNFTQQELADRIGKVKSTIAMYENGSRKPSFKVLKQLTDLFSCSTDYLMGDSDIRKDYITPTTLEIDKNKILEALEIVAKGKQSFIKTNILEIDTTDLNDEDIEEIKEFVRFRRERRKKN